MTEQEKGTASQAVAITRIPFPAAAHQAFGLSQGDWKVLCESTFPGAQSENSVLMALAYCRQRGLDIFKRPVHIVPIWDSKKKRMVETVWPGISELRTTAMRTKAYAGRDPTEFGQTVEMTFDKGESLQAPEWARMTVYRSHDGERVPYPGPTIYWQETYATAKRDSDAPNAMWRRKPSYMLEKCAEAAALRSAFPEELGGEISAEEINPNDASVLQAERTNGGVYAVENAPAERPQREPETESAGAGDADAEPDSEESNHVASDDAGSGDLSAYTGDI